MEAVWAAACPAVEPNTSHSDPAAGSLSLSTLVNNIYTHNTLLPLDEKTTLNSSLYNNFVGTYRCIMRVLLSTCVLFCQFASAVVPCFCTVNTNKFFEMLYCDFFITHTLTFFVHFCCVFSSQVYIHTVNDKVLQDFLV